MPTNILAVDIGGTSSRFASFRSTGGGPEAIEEMCELPTNTYDSLMELLRAAGAEHNSLTPGSAAAVVLAVPGPVEGKQRVRMANVKWPIDLTPVQKHFGECRFYLINDFEAQAFGCLTHAVDTAKCIKDGQKQAGGVLAVIGAGTGLGHCSLKTDRRGGQMAFPSESAHAVFPFVDVREQGYRQYLTETAGIEEPTGDQVVSGRGLAWLHRYLTGEDLPPEQVARRITPESETTRWFARFYGRACRHYALTAVPLAGLFVSGGVAVKNPFLVDNDTWRTEFVRSAAKKELLTSIRVDLVTDEKIGLWGAARYGTEQLSL